VNRGFLDGLCHRCSVEVLAIEVAGVVVAIEELEVVGAIVEPVQVAAMGSWDQSLVDVAVRSECSVDLAIGELEVAASWERWLVGATIGR
jgi:hypothetical protein